MKKSIRVKALWIKGRKTFVLRWRDPATKKWKDETTAIALTDRNRRRAADAARDKERELSGKAREQYTWTEFCERYQAEWLAGKSQGYRDTWDNATKCLRKAIRFTLVEELDSDALHKWVGWMRRQPLEEATIRSYLGTIRPALNWGADIGIIASPPRFPRIRGADKMGGRPITGEEFDRMTAAVGKVHPRNVVCWKRLLKGLWLSGLRISEAVALSWDYGAGFAVDLDAACFAIRKQKSGKAEFAPMTPDFLTFLLETPEARRVGSVFGITITARQASRIVSKIGKRAGVVTGENGEHATAHDLRRSFGSRWASKVHPAELQRLMRHADIATTMKFYVRLDSAAIARKLQLGEKLGENAKKPKLKKRSAKSS